MKRLAFPSIRKKENNFCFWESEKNKRPPKKKTKDVKRRRIPPRQKEKQPAIDGGAKETFMGRITCS